ncbi:Sphingomyelin phosphodiesterase 2 [Operophtera brumata]|uniref:Sphingomyelin phosphodiesterase 2 n=1 Tax=Operophtera brumata TaxID=104452 RepID=A0A0L7LAW8_OPEBR|nr:Sphingomyelin phosphodiesterase 2 [Operophtera brumata]
MSKTRSKAETQKNHICSQCGSAFNRPYRLKQHEKIHQNIKQFKCGEPNCSKSYTNKSHLDRHIYSVHMEPAVNMIYSCELCNCEFITLLDKKRHMKHHKSYSCDLCDMAFVQWSKYLKHKKMLHKVGRKVNSPFFLTFSPLEIENAPHARVFNSSSPATGEGGIPVVSKDRKERFKAIAEYLSESSHNIVCLQEVWSETDYLLLKDYLKDKLPYSHYFYSGVLGSGLCVFSKWLIQDVFFHQWPLNGYIHKIHHGDWFGGKGVGLCRIKCGDKLLNAHSTAEFVHLTTAPADISILAGDLNTGPGDLSYNPTIRKQSGTCDNANNSYSDPAQLKLNPDGKRIDHILFQADPAWESFSYSDHNAVALQMRLRPSAFKRQQYTLRQISKDNAFDETITQAIKVCEEAKQNLTRSKNIFLTLGGLLLMFLIGTVGFWPNKMLYDVIKLVLTGICFYYLLMGTLWNKIEVNSIKAGLGALGNFNQTRKELKNESALSNDDLESD